MKNKANETECKLSAHPGHGTSCNVFGLDAYEHYEFLLAAASPVKGQTAFASIQFPIAAYFFHDTTICTSWHTHTRFILYSECQNTDLHLEYIELRSTALTDERQSC